MLKRYLFLWLSTLALSVVSAIPAQAARILNELEGNNSIRFVVDSQPLGIIVQPDGFVVPDTSVTIDGITGIYDLGFVYEFAAGGLIIDGTIFDLAGPQLYTGTEANPTLLTGRFALGGFLDPDLQFALNVRDLDAVNAVPEPQTWLMLLCGFFFLGAGLRASRSRRLKPSRAL
ncbi:hypothetical protein [Erythrobacter sp. QSSC1-22B]|uniref:hypothetical protein n=1 Tax=Erythrobacter sp. QSSC1-22B TaxID=1860125 RepID=UPI0011A7CD9B|nr:hypothetical protein [Erythrobacter sp. QSSC1-22B]